MLFKCFAGLPKHCRFHMPLFVAVATAVTPISVGNIDVGSMCGLAQRSGASKVYDGAQFPRYHLLSIAIIANNSNHGMQQRHD